MKELRARVLWMAGPAADWYQSLSVFEIGETEAVEHPVDLQGMTFGRAYFHEGGDYLLLTPSTKDSLWGATVVASQPGPLFPIAGAAAGEDDLIEFELEASRTYATVTWEHEDLTRDCEIASLAAAAITATWPVGPCLAARSPRLRGDHLYFTVTDLDNTERIWHLDVADPFAIPEPISAPYQPFGFAAVISPAGQWVFHRTGNNLFPQYHLSGLPEPGETDLLSFDGMIANVEPVVIP